MELTDKSTKICEHCVAELKILVKKKKLIAETDKKMKNVSLNHVGETSAAAAVEDFEGMRRVDGDDSLSDVNVVDLTGPDSPSSIILIEDESILIEDDSDAENEGLTATTVQPQAWVFEFAIIA